MFTFFFCAFVVPFGLIGSSYILLFRAVHISHIIQSTLNSDKTEYQLAIIVIITIGVWFAAWTPYSVVALLGIFNGEQHITPLVSMIPALFCKTAACINPYIYALSNKRFRNEIYRMFGIKIPIKSVSNWYSSSFRTSSAWTRSSTIMHRIRNATNNEIEADKNLRTVLEVSEFSVDVTNRSQHDESVMVVPVEVHKESKF